MKKEKLIGFWMEGKEKSTHGTTKFKKDGNEGTQDLLRWLSDFMWRVAREWRPLSRQRAPPIRSRWGDFDTHTHTRDICLFRHFLVSGTSEQNECA